MAYYQGLEFIMSQSASHGSETAEDRAPGTQVSYVQAAVMDIIAVLLFALLARIAHNSPELPFSWAVSSLLPGHSSSARPPDSVS